MRTNDTSAAGYRGGTNLERARSHNRRAVADAVRRGGALSRARIAKVTGLAPQTVSNIVDELLAAGFLRADPRIRAGRGQPSIPLRINAAGGYGIGIELTPVDAVAALVDLEGAVVARAAHPLTRTEPEHVLPTVEALVDALVARTPEGRDRLLGLGIALPGPFGVEALASSATNLQGWPDPPPALESAARIESRIGMPVFLQHDARAATIGERHYGAARTLDDFVYLYISSGLGAGLFVDGRLYTGRMGNAGEVGHLSVDPAGELCICGNRGCLERYLSIVSARETLGLAGEPARVGAAVGERLARGDVAAWNWARAAGAALRRAMATLENVFDPEAVILGGALPTEVLRVVVDAAMPLLPSVSDRRDRQGARLLIGECGRDTAALGAACMPIFERFNPSFEALMKRRARAG